MGNSDLTVLYVLAALAFSASTGAAFAFGLLRGVSRGTERVALFAGRLAQVEANDETRSRQMSEGLDMLDASFDRSERKRAAAAAAASRLKAATPEETEEEPEPATDAQLRARLGRGRGLASIGR